MAKNSKWQDEYWLLLMQIYLQKPVGMKPMYCRAMVDLSRTPGIGGTGGIGGAKTGANSGTCDAGVQLVILPSCLNTSVSPQNSPQFFLSRSC